MLDDIKNYHWINRLISTGGQPTAEQLAHIRKEGFDVIINLAKDDSPDAIPDEASQVQAMGLNYEHIPVDFEAPSLSDLKKFFATMDRYKHNPVFVHCAYNWRVSAFIFLYRTIRCDIPVAEAITDLHAVWKPDATWQSFIDRMLLHYNVDS